MKLYINFKGYSLLDNTNTFNKILVDKGIVIAIDNDTNGYLYDEVIDLKGNYLFPGFTDSHIHLIGYGRKLLSNNLNNIIDKDLILNKLNDYNKDSKLFVEGYYNVELNNSDLDNISNTIPIILRHNDYHSYTVNTYVLDMFNICSSNGILINEEDTLLVDKLWSSATKEELTNYSNKAIESLLSLGVTKVHTEDLSYFNSYNETLEILKETSNKYEFNIYSLIHHDIYNEYLNGFKASKYLKDIQIKLFYDGTISSKTALLKDNYKNSNTNGIRINDKESFINIIKNIRSNNHSVAIHVIGDLALEEVVDILSKYPTTSNIPDRIIHASLSNIETINQLSKLNISLDIQPLFIKSDSNTINSLIKHDPLVYPFKLYNDSNIVMNSSSDAPVESPNPLLSMYYLNNINRLDVIKSYTVNPSYTINDNNGIISIGSKADFTVFNKDIMVIDNEELLNTKVYATIINGTIKYKIEED